jgi:hypothetical protein
MQPSVERMLSPVRIEQVRLEQRKRRGLAKAAVRGAHRPAKSSIETASAK